MACLLRLCLHYKHGMVAEAVPMLPARGPTMLCPSPSDAMDALLPLLSIHPPSRVGRSARQLLATYPPPQAAGLVDNMRELVAEITHMRTIVNSRLLRQLITFRADIEASSYPQASQLSPCV